MYWLMIASLSTTFATVVPVGYLLGVTNAPQEYIKSWSFAAVEDQYNYILTTEETNYLFFTIVSAFLFGGILGTYSGAIICNNYGRKMSLIVSEVLLTIAAIMFFCCRSLNSVILILLGRLIAGFAAAIVYTCHPMYMIEIAPLKLRGALGVLTGVGVTMGVCIGQVVSLQEMLGGENLWNVALSFYVVFVIIGLVIAPCLPESPRFLYTVKNNPDGARKAYLQLFGSKYENEINLELKDIEISKKNEGEKLSYGQVLTNSDLFLPLVIVCSYQACQQLSGINAIFYYSVPIFIQAGFSAKFAGWLNLGMGVLNLFVSLLGPWLMQTFNRRPLMIVSCLGSAICHILLIIGLRSTEIYEWVSKACIGFMAAFIVFFQIGLSPIPFFIGSELLDVGPRPVAMSMGSLFSWTGNFMIGMVFPIIESMVGSFAFLPCCVFMIYGVLLTWLYVPESRGYSITELAPLMVNGFKSRPPKEQALKN